MAIFLGFGSLYQKVRNPINQMFVAATVILLIRPDELFQPGFQLSFGAVTLLLLWMPTVQEAIERRIKNRVLKAILMVMSVTIVVQTGLTPILAYWFGELSLVAPLSNLFVVPLLSFLMPLSLALLAGAPLFEHIPWVFDLSNGIVQWILLVSDHAGKENLALRLPAPSIEQILFWIVLLAIFLPSISARYRWKLTRTLLSLLLLFETVQLLNELRPSASRAVVLDVGQGDALFFETPGGKRYLIDVGTWSPGWNSGKGVILPFLRSEQIERIHGLFLTHPHADHIGGAAEILSSVRVDTVYRPAVHYDSELSREIQRIITKERIPERTLQAGDLLNLGNELKVYVLNPEQPADEKNVNNASLVMKWQFGETSWMLTGDAEQDTEERILNRFPGESRRFLQSTVLKVGHHGSRTSTTVEFLQAVAPHIAIVPVAFRNRYRHPHQEISERLHAQVKPEGGVYFTSLDGPILFSFDSQKIYHTQALKER
jgi:competence protein ComEC